MDEARSIDEVAALLHGRYIDALPGIIAIDGTDGVGKTTLALGLQATIGGTVVSLDDFVLKNRGGYVPYLKTAELKAALESRTRPCIVEGVCVLAALERVSYKADVFIYVKRLVSYGYWNDEDTCDPTEPVEELIARRAWEVAALARFEAERSGKVVPEDAEPRLTPLREEIIRYHAHYRPSRHADIAFERMDDA